MTYEKYKNMIIWNELKEYNNCRGRRNKITNKDNNTRKRGNNEQRIKRNKKRAGLIKNKG